MSAAAVDELRLEESVCPMVGRTTGAAAYFSLWQCDPEGDRYLPSSEAAMVLAEESSPVLNARAMYAIGSIFMDGEKVKKASRAMERWPWGSTTRTLFQGTEWFFRGGYRAHLPAGWIPALDGVEDKLEAGARVAEVGCGPAR